MIKNGTMKNKRGFTIQRSVLSLLLAGVITIPQITHAAKPVQGELYYGAISDISGNTMNISYNSPSGKLTYTCSVDSLSCKTVNDSTQDTSENGISSPDGKWNVETKRTPQSSMVTYTLYSVSKSKKKKQSTIPYTFNVEGIKFSADSKQVYLELSPTERMIYSIDNKKLSDIQSYSSSTGGPAVSPNGAISATYNGGSYTFISSSGSASYPSSYNGKIQFSKDSRYASVLTLQTDGTHALALLDISSLPQIKVVSAKVNAGPVVTDYVFAGKWLYYVSNDSTPMMWSLVRVNSSDGTKTTIEKHVAYEDNLVVSGTSLFYSKVNGKVLDIYRVTENGKTEKTKGTPVSPVTHELDRKEADFGGSHGAFIQPKGSSNKSLPLIVWMHGGPRRQASIDYHPYLSYAVYDDILEKLALQGARIWKIDYTGSWGYGNQKIYALRNKFGDIEITDVERSIKDISKSFPTSGVYLTGTSYGGYMTLKTIADYPSLVNGGVAINAVTDWQDLITRIPGSPFITEFGGMPGLADTQPRYDKASVKATFGSIDKDPVTIVYGTNDTTVPPYQSTDFLSFAQSLGLSHVSGVPLAGEGHVIQKRSSLKTLCNTMTKTFNMSAKACK